jgi:hypothetical protein
MSLNYNKGGVKSKTPDDLLEAIGSQEWVRKTLDTGNAIIIT